MLVECVARAAKDIFDFVPDQFFHPGARGAKVLARVEFLRIFHEHFADACGERQAKTRTTKEILSAHAAAMTV